jgi:hypothetical protein
MEDLVRRGVLALVVMFVLGVSGIATAGILGAGGSPAAGPPAGDDKAETTDQDSGVHGGPIDRFHNAGSCDLTAVPSLPGNWTHGDYVTAVAADGTAIQIHEAAQSDCGKPMVSVGHGGGPPAHALENMAAGQAHGGGKSEDEGSAALGS